MTTLALVVLTAAVSGAAGWFASWAWFGPVRALRDARQALRDLHIATEELEQAIEQHAGDLDPETAKALAHLRASLSQMRALGRPERSKSLPKA